MVTFDNVLDETVNGVCRWKRKGILREATIIRDVYGKIALLLDNTAAVSDEDSQELETCLDQAIGPFFGGHVYYKKQSHNKRNIETRIQPIVDIIETEREMWREEEGIAFFVSERPIAKKAWIKTSAKQESVWPYEEAIEDGGTKVVAFYSFKGGMGRTTALAAAAINLVRQGKNVMMVDMDIEAPGLATLFFPENRIERGVLDYLLESEIADNTDIHDYVLDVTEPALIEENYGMLYLMPAGKVNEQYLQKLARIDYQDNRENHLRTSVGTMLKRLRDGYGVDYLLIDGPAGLPAELSFLAHIATQAVVVTATDRACIRGAERCARKLEEEYCIQRIRMVLNRVRPQLICRGKSGNIDDAMDEAGLPLLGIVPEDEELIACGNSGKSILSVKRAGAARAFQNIARRLDGERIPLMKI